MPYNKVIVNGTEYINLENNTVFSSNNAILCIGMAYFVMETMDW